MTIEKLFPSGDFLISDIVGGYLIKQRYSGYTKQEAKAEFAAFLKEEKEKKKKK